MVPIPSDVNCDRLVTAADLIAIQLRRSNPSAFASCGERELDGIPGLGAGDLAVLTEHVFEGEDLGVRAPVGTVFIPSGSVYFSIVGTAQRGALDSTVGIYPLLQVPDLPGMFVQFKALRFAVTRWVASAQIGDANLPPPEGTLFFMQPVGSRQDLSAFQGPTPVRTPADLEPESFSLPVSLQVQRGVPPLPSAATPLARALNHLRLVATAYQTGPIPRFLASYVDHPGLPFEFRELLQDGRADLYDNAMAVLALAGCASSDGECAADRERALSICDAMLVAQENDALKKQGLAPDGRLRNIYHPDPHFFISPAPNSATVGVQDLQTFTGNLAWATLALLRCAEVSGDVPYRDGAVRLARYIAERLRSGEITGGFKLAETRSERSTENNLAVLAAYSRLAQATGDSRWNEQAHYARGFVDSTWSSDGSVPAHFLIGTKATGELNADLVIADVQALGVLAQGSARASALTYAETHLRADPCRGCEGAFGFDFNEDSEDDGCWMEGTAMMALAYRSLGNEERATAVFRSLESVQREAPNTDGLGLVATCSDHLDTGLFENNEQIQYYNALQVAPTAWYVLALRADNPLAQP
ncbi:MAG: hypothetical protein HY699_03830 [Deltaproteobacteria bacterium]|nr:hypothetical protein [Deltaproteobacteria bacterium]